jgi:SAM-dependent methyltransferase
MGALNKVRIATHIEVEWLADRTAPAACPNCGFSGQVRQYLDIDYRPPDAVHHFILQICPHCGARFADNPETMDYGTEELIEIGWHVYQIQLGAGVWPITAPLTRLDKPAGAKLLEIGGAYGFGLDFGIRARGWVGEGFDPSPLAAFGARELGLEINQDYFEEKDLGRGPYDIVMATEVIEHLAHPPEFFALMRRAVAADGILLLTTPDAAWITPDLSAGALLPLLSPGAHIVLQTAESLKLALMAAGFGHVEVRREAMSLVAYASPAAFRLIEDADARRALYRRYLLERGALTTPESDLRLGYAGRGLFEAVNDGDFAAADVAWAALLPAVRQRFGLDLETMTALPAGADTADLATLARLMPLGLGMILFGRAMRLLGQKIGRAEILPMLWLAHEAAAALQAALARRSLSDGLSASILATLRTEILLCQAETGDEEATLALIALAAPGDASVIGWRGFVALVNAGAIGLAGDLQAALGLSWPPERLPADLRRDALLSLANFALAPGGDAMRAFDCALGLRALGAAGDRPARIILEAFTRLVNAGAYDAAEAAAAAHGVEALIAQIGGETARDARLAGVTLAFARGRTADALAQLQPLLAAEDDDVAGRLAVDGFVRLVNESQFAAARRLAAAAAIDARLKSCAPALRDDALAAGFMLALQPGAAPGEAIARAAVLTASDFYEARLTDLLFAGFVSAVNGADEVTARALQPLILPRIIKLRRPFTPGARDALFAQGVFDSQAGDLPRAAASFARLRDDIVKSTDAGAQPDPLFWHGLRGELAALMRLGRGEEAGGLIADFATRFAGAPDDLLALMPATGGPAR